MRDLLRVRRKQDKGSQAGRADGVALGHGFRRIANGIQGIRDVSDRLREVRHLRDAAGIVGDWPVGIDGNDDAGHRQHRHGGDGDPVETEVAGARLLVQKERDQDARTNDQHRQCGAEHADRLPGDDVRRRAGRRGARNQPHRWIVGTREELGDRHQRDGHNDADHGGPEEVDIQADEERHREKTGQREHGADGQAPIERAHDPGPAAEPHEEGADHRSDDRDGTQDQGIEHVLNLAGEEQAAQQHGGDRRDRVGLEQVGGHPRAVADVVAHVVRDDGGIPGIVFRDARFDFADQVGAHVGRLGVDATTEAGEDTDQAGAERQAD